MFKSIFTENAPQAVGPYSQAVRAGDFIFLSGQIPIDSKTNQLVESDIVKQTRQVLQNIKGILESENLSMKNIVKTTLFITDMNLFSAVNEEYGKFFGQFRPARSTVEVSRLPKDVLIEIEAIAAYQE